MQLLCVLFALKVLKFEEIASGDPIGKLNSQSPFRSPPNALLRFAIAAAVYLVLGQTNWFRSVPSVYFESLLKPPLIFLHAKHRVTCIYNFLSPKRAEKKLRFK